jgi:hypothetical protein
VQTRTLSACPGPACSRGARDWLETTLGIAMQTRRNVLRSGRPGSLWWCELAAGLKRNNGC